MADEGLREIQLNGKQLVFLFMASTVVAVVIFLCGVMVGRGVRAQRASDVAEASVEALTDPTASTPSQPQATPSAAFSSSNTPVASQETLTYPDRLEGQEPPDETLNRIRRARGFCRLADPRASTGGAAFGTCETSAGTRTKDTECSADERCAVASSRRACREGVRRAGRGGQRPS
jgi:hypothetical protein